jgi:hypothetical protein
MPPETQIRLYVPNLTTATLTAELWNGRVAFPNQDFNSAPAEYKTKSYSF